MVPGSVPSANGPTQHDERSFSEGEEEKEEEYLSGVSESDPDSSAVTRAAFNGVDLDPKVSGLNWKSSGVADNFVSYLREETFADVLFRCLGDGATVQAHKVSWKNVFHLNVSL